ncbi:MAG: response regulator, partial [Myxococcales bacterium]|nr:response regulator [Myxococcales bacterium]
QKMEAIGQLVGGVAHDFNNLLTVIKGNLELAMTEDQPSMAMDRLREAMSAADDAAALTHQLLAFSRKQPLRPHQVDPRALVVEMEALLRRTLGERYELEIVGSAGQWTCEVDGAQLKSAVLNLAINARDAMPNGGKITIETANIRIGREYAEEHEDLVPGAYVLIAVSDTGAGMSEEVQKRAFEPFFTTKGVGRGSGLGLSMVYGFIKQSRGHVKIYSEQFVGTTVKLYLPRSTSETAAGSPIPKASETTPRGDGHIVLVVEDDASVRRVTVRILASLGYVTHDYADAAEALVMLRGESHVDLLLTDVVLAGEMNGVELVAEARRLRPGLPVLYVSGYTENAILHHGRLDAGVELLEKPFTKKELGQRVHAVLTKHGE